MRNLNSEISILKIDPKKIRAYTVFPWTQILDYFEEDETVTTQFPSILGLDPSLTNLGFASISSKSKTEISIPEVGTISLKSKSTDRLKHFVSILPYLLLKYMPNVVVVEDYAYGASNKSHQIGELGGLVRLVIAEYSEVINQFCLSIFLSPTQVKKFATGVGNSKKNIMLMHMFKQFGIELKDDNQADAFYLAAMGSLKTYKSLLGHKLKDLELTESQQKIISDLRFNKQEEPVSI